MVILTKMIAKLLNVIAKLNQNNKIHLYHQKNQKYECTKCVQINIRSLDRFLFR